MEKFSGKKKVAIFISGRGSNLKSLIKYANRKKSLIKIILVISDNPDAKGLKFAHKSKIKSYKIKYKNRSSFENKTLRLLKKSKIELICLAGFMKILSGKFIEKFSHPILNIHPSLLPKYKGLNTHKRVLKNKDNFSGATIHIVSKKLDSGKIIFQKKTKILKTDDEKSLEKKILKIEHEIYPKAIEKFLSNL